MNNSTLLASESRPFAFKIVVLEMPDGTEKKISVVMRAEDVDPLKGNVSQNSPLGKALLAGENSYKLPSGEEVPIKILREEATDNGRGTK